MVPGSGIGSFGSVGRVIDLPRVPDKRVGVYNGAGLLGGVRVLVNNCQQCRKQPFQGAHSLLGRLWDGLGWGNFIFG